MLPLTQPPIRRSRLLGHKLLGLLFTSVTEDEGDG